jgi:hypothetical protein
MCKVLLNFPAVYRIKQIKKIFVDNIFKETADFETGMAGKADLGPVPEIIDPVFAKTIPKRSFSVTEYERFGLVFTKTRVYKFGHRQTDGKNLVWFGELERKLAKLSKTTFACRSSS